MSMRPGNAEPAGRLNKIAAWSALLLLALAWVLGGSTQHNVVKDLWLDLLSLPVLLAAAVVHLQKPPRTLLSRCAVLVLVAGFVAVALQLARLPSALWLDSPVRVGLAGDLAAAGVPAPSTWSLTPHGTELALWKLLPALAMFLAGLAAPRGLRRGMLLAVIGLAAINLVFSLQQESLPQHDAMRLYPDTSGSYGGVFYNQNHFATALVIAMALAVCLAWDAWRRRIPGRRTREMQALGLMIVASFGLFAVPLTNSSAGVTLVLVVLPVTLLLSGILQVDWFIKHPAFSVAGILALAGGVSLAMYWQTFIDTEDLRGPIAEAAFRLGGSYFPWGSGAGSFTPVFEANLPASLWIPQYVNHAHNEYAQWWLVGGLAAIAVVACGLWVFSVAGWRVLLQRGRTPAVVLAAGCWAAIAAALIHSWVDYPLGTTALAATVALLAGILFSCLDELGGRDSGASRKRGRGPPVAGPQDSPA